MLSYKSLPESHLSKSQWLTFFRTLSMLQEGEDSSSVNRRGYFLLKDEDSVRVFLDIQPDYFLENYIRDGAFYCCGPLAYHEIAWVLLPIQAEVTEERMHRFAKDVKVHSMNQLFLRKLIPLLTVSGPFPIQHKLAVTAEEKLVIPLGLNQQGLSQDLELVVSEYLLV